MNNILCYLRRFLRYFYRKKLKNRNFSLITNNCIGGIISHDMHLRFLSPTINLYIENEEFILFCTYLREYLSLDIERCTSLSKPFPVGVLHGKHGDVHIYFMHFDSFENAVLKWNERKTRIDFDNLFILMEAQQCDDSILEKFNDIPYAHKVMLTSGKRDIANSFSFDEKFYSNNYWPGKLLEYPTIGLHRYMDKFDYVRWFNSGQIRTRYI
jgi:uncharacterized protein (DUF1919 family)